MALKLYDYWRSSAAYRLRIALQIKGVDFDPVQIDLHPAIKQHLSDAYRALNPQMRVPAIELNGEVIGQSTAILEWIEETWPDPALLPGSANDRALVRGWSAAIGCDIHPVQNLRILKAAAAIDGSGLDGMKAWANRWITTGLEGLEALVADHRRSSDFLFGDTPGMAEVYLVPQLYNARRWGVDLAPFPTLSRADAAARALPAFAEAEPERQPDAES